MGFALQGAKEAEESEEAAGGQQEVRGGEGYGGAEDVGFQGDGGAAEEYEKKQQVWSIEISFFRRLHLSFFRTGLVLQNRSGRFSSGVKPNTAELVLL